LKALQQSLMEQQLGKDPDDFAAHFNLGAVLQSDGKVEPAIGHFREALRIRPNEVRR